MGLFALEHKGLWRKTGTWICVLLCFVYFVVYGSVLSYQWFNYGSIGDDPTNIYNYNFDGYSAIRSYKEMAADYGGFWTDEALQKMVRDYNEQGHPGLQQMADWTLALLYLNRLYPELKDPEQQYMPMIYYVDAEDLTGFYEQRQAYLEHALQVNRQNGLLTEDDVAMLLQMNSRVEEPWRYEWVNGWDSQTGYLANIGSRLAPYLAIVLAFTFSGEWHNSTAPLLHTTKYGWRKLARVKILSGLAFAVELYLLIVGSMVATQLVYLGTDGWDIPIQFVSLLAVAPWNMLQAELYVLAFLFLGVVGYAGVVMLLSALVKNNVLSVVLSLAFIYVPGLLERYLPRWLEQASQYLPLVGSASDIFGCNVFHIFGKGVWTPYMLITVPILIGLACIPLAIRSWARRQKT